MTTVIDKPYDDNSTYVRRVLEQDYGVQGVDIVMKYVADAPGREPRYDVAVRGGYVTLQYFGSGRYSLEDFSEKSPVEVDSPSAMGYSSTEDDKPSINSSARATTTRKGRSAMPARKQRQEPEEVAANGNGEVEDLSTYLDKDITPTMVDFGVWFEENVAAFQDVEPDRLLALGSTLYPKFQRSEFNQTRRAERRAAREAEVPAPAEEAAPAAPARRGRAAAKPAAAEAEAPAKAAAAPKRRGRAAATASAPY